MSEQNNEVNNNIHELKQPAPAEQSQQQKEPALTGTDIQNMGAAYARLMELRSQKVLTVNTETEVRGLVEYLSGALLAHANELLACWIAVRNEYEPVLNMLARIATRVSAIQSIKAAQRATQSLVIKPN